MDPSGLISQPEHVGQIPMIVGPLCSLTSDNQNAIRNDSEAAATPPSALAQLLPTVAPPVTTTAPIFKLLSNDDLHHSQTTKDEKRANADKLAPPTNAPEKSNVPAGNLTLQTYFFPALNVFGRIIDENPEVKHKRCSRQQMVAHFWSSRDQTLTGFLVPGPL